VVDSGNQYNASNIKTAQFNGGNLTPLQPVSDRGNGYHGYGRQRVSNDNYRSPYRTYETDSRYGGQRYNTQRAYSPRAPYRKKHVSRGGEYVVVAGDTLYGIAKRHGMTTGELMALNDLRGADIQPGQRLRVSSGYTASNRQTPRNYDRYSHERYSKRRRSQTRPYEHDQYENGYARKRDHHSDERRYANRRNRDYNHRNDYERDSEADVPRRKKTAQRSERSEYPEHRGQRRHGRAVKYTVRRGDTIYSIARRNSLSQRELAEFNDIPMSATLYPGQILHLPRDRKGGGERDQASRGSSAKHAEKKRTSSRKVADNRSKSKSTKSKPVAVAEVHANTSSSGVEDVAITGGPGSRSAVVGDTQSQDASEKPEETAATNNAESEAHLDARECKVLLANPKQRSAKHFREPVQGKIISKFGPKEDGSFNDGVNFLVPQGTPVKAAENGVVAYAGDELSGFGNLVLIRHSDGFVTAYAHNEKLKVKRCDVVERGQVIGLAGTTGNAAKPQLHFELRKNSKPVDPVTYFSRS
jgi:murein DD-endopeptidase MepM/ murein hydrolase activator NlpD